MTGEAITLSDQLGSSLIISYFIEYLKNWKYFPFLESFHNSKYKFYLSGFFALLTTIGITHVFNYDPSIGGKLIIDIPSAHDLMINGWNFTKQWVFQHGIYHAVVKSSVPNE